ncbi:hypothetical protein [Streptomyces sp. NBC_00239]|uniref:hypothetical protein n=1 Tax=Streptomyces sp. NBC_00239 TaxID=2903640 RepID=UPI002E2846E5|nr:hypothetical protein [Streptomyces sp. NBC_00239]
MLKKLLGKLAVPPIHEAAQAAWDRGDTVFIRKAHPSPTKQDRDIAEAVQRVTAIGWDLRASDWEGAGLSRHVTLTFTRP